MPRKAKDKKDRTSLVISLGLHALMVGAVAYWAYKTGKLELIRQAVLQYVKPDKKQEKKEEPIQQRAAPPKLPPINQGMPPQSSGGTRRAIAADAPTATGESFFQDTRRQGQGPSTAGSGGSPKAPLARIALSPSPVIPRPAFAPPPPSTVKQLLAERAKAAASIEAVGAEQISKAGASDAGAAVTKVAGATIVEGKFAVIRGLGDRYISTTLNGANIPSADPYRQSASLDLFPSQVIDKVVASKTFTPDQPGDYTGGGINIVTRSFPETPFLSGSLGTAYNTQSSLNNHFLTYKGGGLDWAGMDDGSRALPAIVSAEAPIAPTGRALPPAVPGNLPPNSPRLAGNYLLDDLTHEMGTTEFAPKREAPPLNQNFSIAGGGTTHLFGRPFGYFGGGSYKHDYWFYEDGVSQRIQNGTEIKSSYSDARSLSVVNWSGMVNLAYQPFEDHELGFIFFYNQNAVDDSRVQDNGFEKNGSGIFRKFNLYWTERNLNTYQIKGEHRFPEVGGLKFDWLVALTQTTQDEPDARFLNDNNTGNGYESGGNGVPSPSKPTRYFRNLEENNLNAKLDWTLPFHNWTAEEGQFKFGLFNSSSERTFTERQFYYPGGGGYNGDPNQLLTDATLGATIRTNANKTVNFNWHQYIQVFDSLYNGERDVQAAYFMLDVPVVEKIRLIGGARYETTDFNVHSESYLASSVTSQKINDAKIVQSDLLPSAGLIYAVKPDMNIRLNYSQTIARPSFRELAAYYSYDPIINDFIEGNPLLKMTSIDNYDVRWEWFPRPGELLSVSIFYKNLANAIERGDLKIEGDVITFLNREKAKLYGLEFEGRKNLEFLGAPFKPFSLGGNLSLIQSEVHLTENEIFNKSQFFPNVESTRPLYDQSPYVMNLDLNYDNPYAGTSAAFIFSMAGPRIAITKLNAEDVYEHPAPALDFVISQKIGRHTSVKLLAKNLLDPRIERTYGKNSGLLYDSYKRGRTFGLTFNYDF